MIDKAIPPSIHFLKNLGYHLQYLKTEVIIYAKIYS